MELILLLGRTPNVEVTAAGAQVALGMFLLLQLLCLVSYTGIAGLMYLKTNNETIAAKLQVPETHFLLERVRPDQLLMRVVCRSLVLWDSVEVRHLLLHLLIIILITYFRQQKNGCNLKYRHSSSNTLRRRVRNPVFRLKTLMPIITLQMTRMNLWIRTGIQNLSNWHITIYWEELAYLWASSTLNHF